MSGDKPRIGIDLGGTKIEGVALGGSGNILARRRIATPRDDYPGTIAVLHDLVRALEAEIGTSATVGVGMPGAISPASGLVKNANSTWLNGKSFHLDLEARIGRPIRFANDADCLALSEASDGAAAGAPTVFGAILGTGVGGGIVVNGRLLAGPNAIAGEWGHSPLPWPREDERPGPACYCGKQGCIETFLSGPGLAADHLHHGGARQNAEDIAAQAEAGDPKAQATLARYADRLARSLATVINLIDPHVIVLGGGVGQIDGLYREVPRLWASYVFSDQVATRLAKPIHGASSGVRGAAWLWPLS